MLMGRSTTNAFFVHISPRSSSNGKFIARFHSNRYTRLFLSYFYTRNSSDFLAPVFQAENISTHETNLMDERTEEQKTNNNNNNEKQSLLKKNNKQRKIQEWDE